MAESNSAEAPEVKFSLALSESYGGLVFASEDKKILMGFRPSLNKREVVAELCYDGDARLKAITPRRLSDTFFRGGLFNPSHNHEGVIDHGVFILREYIPKKEQGKIIFRMKITDEIKIKVRVFIGTLEA